MSEAGPSRTYRLSAWSIALLLIVLIVIQAIFLLIAVRQRNQDILNVSVADASRSAFSIYNTFYPLSPQERENLAENLVYINYSVRILDEPDFAQSPSGLSWRMVSLLNIIADHAVRSGETKLAAPPQVVTSVDDVEIKWYVGGTNPGDGVFRAKAALSFPDGQWLRVDYRQLYWVQTNAGTLLEQFGLQLLLQLALAVVVLLLVLRPLRQLASFARRIDPEDPLRDLDDIPRAGLLEVSQMSDAYRELLHKIHDFTEQRFRILASLSHDLRNPIHRLKMQLENEPDLQHPEQLHDSLNELQGMAEQSIDMARTGKNSEEFRMMDLAWLLENIVLDYQDGHPQTADALSLRLVDSGLVEVRPESFRRCVENLVDNAVRYGQRADIELSRQGDLLVVGIRDQGPGIPEEDLDRVFEPFFRLDRARSSKTGGSGLGLSIARGLARTSKASLKLENCPDGGLLASIAFEIKGESEDGD